MAQGKGLASQSLEGIAKVWQLDEVRSNWSEEGFEWWPGDFRVSVMAQPNARQRESERWRVIIRTDFLKDVPVHDEQFTQCASVFSRFMTSTYAWAYPISEVWKELVELGSPNTMPTMWFANCAYVDAENVGWIPEFLARMAIMQPINAQIQAHNAPEWLKGGIPDTSHPEHLADAGLDEVLEVAARIYVPIGREDCRWAGTKEFSDFAEQYAKNDNCFGFGDEKPPPSRSRRQSH
jgi:hypothetical protein